MNTFLAAYQGGFVEVIELKDHEALMAGKPGAPGHDPARLRIALDHIRKTATQSRTQSRRLRWIEQRAVWALEGRKYDNTAFDLPKDAGTSAVKAELKAVRLQKDLDAALVKAKRWDWIENEIGQLKSSRFELVMNMLGLESELDNGDFADPGVEIDKAIAEQVGE